jgi:uncharacterized membrane protein YgdD (TMEM256/DUF423 family)
MWQSYPAKSFQDAGTVIMRWVWPIGVLHALVGTALLFLSLHPLRDALDQHALELVRAGSTLETLQGLALMLIARTKTALAAVLIAAGTTIWAAMLYFIAFTGQHPLDLVVPVGGFVMLLGWLVLLLRQAD